MRKGERKARQYRFNNRGEILVVQAFNKPQVQRYFGTSNLGITKYCLCLKFEKDRSVDVDLTSEVEK